jgi:hypothetical protein
MHLELSASHGIDILEHHPKPADMPGSSEHIEIARNQPPATSQRHHLAEG